MNTSQHREVTHTHTHQPLSQCHTQQIPTQTETEITHTKKHNNKTQQTHKPFTTTGNPTTTSFETHQTFPVAATH